MDPFDNDSAITLYDFDNPINQVEEEGEESINILDILPEDTLFWLDSSDMYKEKEFFGTLGRFRRIYLDQP